MHPKLRSSLHEAIEDWITDSCDSSEWEAANFICGARTAEFMTHAAESVLDGLIEAQDHARAEELLVDPAIAHK